MAVLLALLLAVPGAALAASRPDDPQSAFVLDLRPAGGSTYHFHCHGGAPLSECGTPSLWQNANRLDGLQVRREGPVDPDAQLVP